MILSIGKIFRKFPQNIFFVIVYIIKKLATDFLQLLACTAQDIKVLHHQKA
jgi:hypothetical protein